MRSCNNCENQLCVAGDRFVAGSRQTQMLKLRRSTLTRDGVKTRCMTMATSRKRCTCTCRRVHWAGSNCTLRRASTGCGIFDGQRHMACLRVKSLSTSMRTGPLNGSVWDESTPGLLPRKRPLRSTLLSRALISFKGDASFKEFGSVIFASGRFYSDFTLTM